MKATTLNEGGGGSNEIIYEVSVNAACSLKCLRRERTIKFVSTGFIRDCGFGVRAIFNCVSKVIRDCIGFGSLCIVIGLENSRQPLSQSDAKLKPIATWSLAFSRARGRLHAFTLSSHWLLLIFSSVLIGRCDYFGFGLRHSIEKRSSMASWYSVWYGGHCLLSVSYWCSHRFYKTERCEHQ